MPRKQQTTTKSVDESVSTTTAKKSKSESKVAPSKKVAVPAAEDTISDVEASSELEGTGAVENSKDLINISFDEIVSFIEAEVAGLKASQTKTTGVKFLRSIVKKVKLLKNKVSKTMKQKRVTRKTSTNTNSGFLKPVHISKELAKFGGWKPEEQISRVSVTKNICKYIKDHDLQNPTDRRQIVPDSKLSKLLNYDASKEDKPLTYYGIQTHLKNHFVKSVTATA